MERYKRADGDVKWYEITDRDLYMKRREFLKRTGKIALVAATALMLPPFSRSAWPQDVGTDFSTLGKSIYSAGDRPNTFGQATSYNNFYEFGFGKGDPARLAPKVTFRPWTVGIEGLVRKPETIDVDALIRRHPLEERIYRLRCVEAWSMVIPWVGFPLADLVKRAEPLSQARYVQFVTLHDPQRMPGQRATTIEWPYVEGLRIDEAMNPLTILAVGMYGKTLPNQNGAPIRLVVPWKYGFKSIKSIVSIRFLKDQPQTTWNLTAPHEYGFYANVNPNVDHPRWSQKTERRIGELGRKETLLFNGYGEYVAGLYKNMDLRTLY